jgi:hypothetical protein
VSGSVCKKPLIKINKNPLVMDYILIIAIDVE